MVEKEVISEGEILERDDGDRLYTNMYLTNPSLNDRMLHKINFCGEFSFETSDFTNAVFPTIQQ